MKQNLRGGGGGERASEGLGTVLTETQPKKLANVGQHAWSGSLCWMHDVMCLLTLVLTHATGNREVLWAEHGFAREYTMTMTPALIVAPSLMLSAHVQSKQTLLHCKAHGAQHDTMLCRATAAIHQQNRGAGAKMLSRRHA